jgi:hypothetical protein
MTCPILHLGTHYAITDRWPVLMLAAIATPLPIQSEPIDLHAGDLHLARWDGRFFTILPGYACDGYSPVIRVCGRWVRLTPTPRAGLWPPVLHDALRQFLPVPGCPWSRRDTDAWFYDALRAGGVRPHHAGIYHGAVAGPLGTAWLHITRTQDPTLRITPASPLHTPRATPAPALQTV